MLANTSPLPYGINIESAEGCWITDKNGKQYLDFIAGIGVNNLGHNIEEINQAVSTQMAKYSHAMVYGEFQQDSVNEFAESLTKLLPENLNTVYPVNSGTEANELAIKLAKKVSNRYEIIAFKGAYHGNSMGSMSISHNELKKSNFRPLIPGTRFIELNNSADLELITNKTAAVILETIQGDAGVQIPNEKYLLALKEKCIQTGALLILDEIQCGYGRTGKFSAFEHYSITPDILTLGKALGGGLPIGAAIASKEIMAQLETNPMLGHITTFGGNPVVCAAANAGLLKLSHSKLIDTVEAKGALIENLLSKNKAIKAIRRKGLMLGIELSSEELVNNCILKAKEKGLIIYWFLSTRNAFRISPPLSISEEEIKIGCGIITDILDEIA